VAGPYVDYICTHQYTFTVSVPVACQGRFAGVAGADILAGEVERLVLPGLAELGEVAVLISGTGRVIASNTALVLPGTAVTGHRLCDELVPVAGHGWASRRAFAGGSVLDDVTAPASPLTWTLLSQPG
jgi:hypothetical protein